MIIRDSNRQDSYSYSSNNDNRRAREPDTISNNEDFNLDNFDVIEDQEVIKIMKQYRKVLQNKLLKLWMEDYTAKMSGDPKYDANAVNTAQFYIGAKITEILKIDQIEKITKIDESKPEKLKVKKWQR